MLFHCNNGLHERAPVLRHTYIAVLFFTYPFLVLWLSVQTPYPIIYIIIFLFHSFAVSLVACWWRPYNADVFLPCARVKILIRIVTNLILLRPWKPRDLWLPEPNFASHNTRGQQNSQNVSTLGTGAIGIPSLRLLRFWTLRTPCLPKRVQIFGIWIASGAGGTYLGSIERSILWITGSRNMVAVRARTLERSYSCASQMLDGALSCCLKNVSCCVCDTRAP